MRSNNFIEVVAVNRKSPTADDTTRATDSPGGTCYALDNAAAQASERFVALSALSDAQSDSVSALQNALGEPISYILSW